MMSNPIVNIEPEQPDVRIEISVANEGWTPVKGVDYFTKEDRAEIVDEVKQEIGEITSSDDSVKWVDDPYSAGATGKAVLGYPEPDSDALAYTTRNGKAMVLPNRVSINGQEYDADPYGTIRLPEEFYPTAASKDKRGGVKIGDGLELDGDTAYVPFATAAKPGIIRPGKGLIVTDYGQINVDGAVLYTDAQGLPEEMKSTARQNIGAASAQDVEQLTEEKVDKTYTQSVSVAITEDNIVRNALVTATGDTPYTDLWDCTSMIALPFITGTPITVRCTILGGGSLVFMGDGGEVLGYINGDNATGYGITPGAAMQTIIIMPPNGTTHIRMCAFKGEGGTYSGSSDFMLSGRVAVEVVEMLKAMDARTAVLDTRTKTVSIDIADEDIVDGASISGYPGMEGEFVEISAWKCTELIPLVFDKATPVTFRCTIYANSAIAFYNENGNAVEVISSYNASDYGIEPTANMQQFSVVPPVNAKYVRMSAWKDYTTPSDFVIKGQVTTNLGTRVQGVEDYVGANTTDFSNVRTLVFGDSISADYYGSYKKWVSHLIESGFFSTRNVNNDSIHATGFVARYNNAANDFITRIEAVSNPESYDLVIVFGGINDYIQSIPMGESGGDKTANFKPAVDDFFATLTERFAGARIAVLTPLRTSNYNDANTAGHTQSDYADYIKTVAESYALPLLDLTNRSGFHPADEAFRQRWTFKDWTGGDGTQGDGVHPIEEYERKYLAPMIRHFLQGLI